MSDSVGQYLNEIGAVALLNAQEERELSQIIEKGFEARARKEAGEKGRDIDKAIREAAAAKDRFIRANLRLVVSVARRYPLPPGMELLDLIQEGNLGLDPRGRQVRLAQGLQVLHLRHLLDPPGDRPGARPEGQPHPASPATVQRQLACRPACRRPATATMLDRRPTPELHRLTTPVSLDKHGRRRRRRQRARSTFMANGDGTAPRTTS